MTYSNKQFFGATSATGPAWKVVPWWWPARWFGYRWARLYERYSPGSHMEYRTDKQMANAMLERLR